MKATQYLKDLLMSMKGLPNYSEDIPEGFIKGRLKISIGHLNEQGRFNLTLSLCDDEGKDMVILEDIDINSGDFITLDGIHLALEVRLH